jgi:hypothetical protein
MGFVVVWGDSVEMNGIRHAGVWFGRSERDARARPIDGSGAGLTKPDGGSGAMASAPSPSASRRTTRTEPTVAARPLCASGNRVVNCPGRRQRDAVW